MTKHVAGLILFSFIVAASGIIAFVFAEIPQPEKTVQFNVPRFESKMRCDKSNHDSFENSNALVKVAQSVFNERTGLLDTDLFIKRKDASTKSVSVALHFFVKDLKGARYLATENYYFKPDFDSRNEATVAIPSRSYGWLDNISSQENLYVIADAEMQSDYKKYKSSFDENKATAIISLKGK
jgi:hypothetical protein